MSKGCFKAGISYHLPHIEEDFKEGDLERIAEVTRSVNEAFQKAPKEYGCDKVWVKLQWTMNSEVGYKVCSSVINDIQCIGLSPIGYDVLFYGSESEVVEALGDFIEIAGVPDSVHGDGDELVDKVLEQYGKKTDYHSSYKNPVVDIDTPSTN